MALAAAPAAAALHVVMLVVFLRLLRRKQAYCKSFSACCIQSEQLCSVDGFVLARSSCFLDAFDSLLHAKHAPVEPSL